MRCEFTERAEQDLENIGDTIAEDNMARALTFVQELRAHCEQLTLAPQRVVVDWIGDMPVRKVVHGNYLIYFAWLEAEDIVVILHIRHGARDAPDFANVDG